MKNLTPFVFLFVLTVHAFLDSRAEASSEPVPEPRIAAFEDLGFGMFVHWGLYSQLGQGEWALKLREIPLEEYEPLADTFTAEDFDAREYARFAKAVGVKYITLTSRHHDGFSLYDTKGLNDYDAPHSAAQRDLIKEFVEACRAEGIVPFLYHTTLDWRWKGKRTDQLSEEEFNEYLDYLHASIEIICTNYGKIGGVWLDGDWSRKESDWKHDRLYGIIRKHQPNAIIVNNSGIHHAGKLSHREVDSVTFENQAAKPIDRSGYDKYFAGEQCHTMNNHWGIGKDDLNYKSPKEIIYSLANCRRLGVNYLLNIGPEGQGAIGEMESATLRTVGRWTETYADALYKVRPYSAHVDGDDFIVKGKDGHYYWYVYNLSRRGSKNVTVQGKVGPGKRSATGFLSAATSVEWLDNGESLEFEQDGEQLDVSFSGYAYGVNMIIRVARIRVD
ncbi:alpha-L-fucosidase [Pelagicoccus mobilis]|uniref:alpha-L-fucosidase n=1 Tax=Pelagicoccus mobilis TaxID=415221 RepID=A0A934RWY3_9BACT|nr:alpha-L-fucosidase [Pelagicoccus mobilis]MBK1875379.1 alpha-L-fucosidase [Pelagicoccus mobilis]